MAAVSETIVREYFELHGFFVRQQRKYIAPTRREDEEIDFFVLNPRHVAAGQPLPFVLTSEDLHGSKPYGPSGDPRTSGEVPTRFAPRASPSPSPRPSPSGRGRILRWLAQPSAASARRTSRTTGPAAGCSLSLWEGQGEGIGLPFDTATWTLSEIVEPRESTGSAGGFP